SITAFDVLSHADADVCLFTPTEGIPYPEHRLLAEPRSRSAIRRLPRRASLRPTPPVTRQPQPAFPYFLHNLTASAADTSGFLHTSLSKILGNAHGSPPLFVSPTISDQR